LRLPRAGRYFAIKIPRRVLRVGFVVLHSQLATRPPSGPTSVREIKHDGYRLIVRRDGLAVHLFWIKAISCEPMRVLI
jgi:ATP-dependent DNA ligase